MAILPISMMTEKESVRISKITCLRKYKLIFRDMIRNTNVTMVKMVHVYTWTNNDSVTNTKYNIIFKEFLFFKYLKRKTNEKYPIANASQLANNPAYIPTNIWNETAVRKAEIKEILSFRVSSLVKKYTDKISNGPKIAGIYSTINELSICVILTIDNKNINVNGLSPDDWTVNASSNISWELVEFIKIFIHLL